MRNIISLSHKLSGRLTSTTNATATTSLNTSCSKADLPHIGLDVTPNSTSTSCKVEIDTINLLIPCNTEQSCIVLNCIVLCCVVLYCTALYPTLYFVSFPHPILSYPILPYPILSYPTLSYPILPYPTLPYPTLRHLMIIIFVLIQHSVQRSFASAMS